MKKLTNKYSDDVQFFIVYTREAHAIDSDRPTGRTQVEQPISTEERRKVADDFLKDMKLKEVPALLDDIKDTAAKAYASLPDRLYLIGKDGKIAYAGDRGPRGFRPSELEDAIVLELEENYFAELSGESKKPSKTSDKKK